MSFRQHPCSLGGLCKHPERCTYTQCGDTTRVERFQGVTAKDAVEVFGVPADKVQDGKTYTIERINHDMEVKIR